MRTQEEKQSVSLGRGLEVNRHEKGRQAAGHKSLRADMFFFFFTLTCGDCCSGGIFFLINPASHHSSVRCSKNREGRRMHFKCVSVAGAPV